MRKQSNLLLFIVLSVFLWIVQDKIDFSTNLVAAFSSQETAKTIEVANNLGYSKELLIAVKGFDKGSKQKIERLAQQIQKLPHVKTVYTSAFSSANLQDYFQNNYVYLARFTPIVISESEVSKRLQTLYENQMSSPFYTPVNKKDPLNLFQFSISKSPIVSSNDLILQGYGYMMRAVSDVSPSDLQAAQELYDGLAEILCDEQNVVAFAPFFYTVENSRYIKQDVTLLIVVSTVLLLIVYFIMLRNLALLFHTIVALSSSMIFALLVSTLVFSQIHVLALAFGMSITAVSVDYLFHYYFHGFYKRTKITLDKNVFFGFLTTAFAFGVFLFTSIPLIEQISFFALISLGFAYVVFTFIFPYIGIQKDYKISPTTSTTRFGISYVIVIFISIVFLLYLYYNAQFNTNLKDLDYQNHSLQSTEKLFHRAKSDSFIPVIVKASNKEELLERLEILQQKDPKSYSLSNFVLSNKSCMQKQNILKKYDFQKLREIVASQGDKIGFRAGYFQDAYSFVHPLNKHCHDVDLKLFAPYGLQLYSDGTTLYTMAFVQDKKAIQNIPYIATIDIKALLNQQSHVMIQKMLVALIIVIVGVIILSFISVGKKLLYALSYIIFPVSFALSVITYFSQLNLMHIFASILLVAIGIDFGIYMSNTKKKENTILAIKYSLLSTFAGFGVLFFSSVTALSSIGSVISLGSIAIYILIKVMR